MKQRSIQSSEIPTIPVNGSAVMLDDRMVVMDNLDVSVNSDRAFDDKSLFPFRLALNTIQLAVNGKTSINANTKDYELAEGMCAVLAAGTMVQRITMGDDARFILVSSNLIQSFQTDDKHRCIALQPSHVRILIEAYRMLRTVLTDEAFAEKREEAASHCIRLMADVIACGIGNQSGTRAKATRQEEIVARFQ